MAREDQQSNTYDMFDDIETGYEPDTDTVELVVKQPYMSLSQRLYEIIASLGEQAADYTKRIILTLFNILKAPIAALFRLLKIIFLTIQNLFSYAYKNTEEEFLAFRSDVRAARSKLRKNKQLDEEDREAVYKLLSKFINAAFKRHTTFLKRAASYFLPICAGLVFVIVINFWNNLNFALEVKYNDINIGYIESEKVFRQAEEILGKRLEIGGQDYNPELISDPEYKIAVVSLNELSDSNQICEQIIENSDSSLVTACGVYVDDKFIASVKNESDASFVFKSLVSDYCKKNNINEKDSQLMVDTVEKISYSQGLYSEKTLVTSDDLKEYLLTQSKSENSKYTVKSSDTPSSISNKFSLTLDQFYALNPNLNKGDAVKENSSVNIIKSIPFINISVSKTQTSTREFKYKTVEIKTDTLYHGIQRVASKGKNGIEEVTSLVTYVNGMEVSSEAISSTVIKQAVDQKVYVGTKPVPSSVTLYGVSGGTFAWPVVGANYVTSGFGYRSLYGKANFHRGVDISGSGALGNPIIASASGIVEKVTASNTGYGYSVLIDHGNSIKTRYAHCLAGSIIVNVGDQVVQGQMIARLGSTGNSTGPHLHFEIIYNGAYTNALDYLTR